MYNNKLREIIDFSVLETAVQIKKCWENVKSSRDKVLAKEKHMKMGTGVATGSKYVHLTYICLLRTSAQLKA